MREEIRRYFDSMLRDIPLFVYEGLLLAFCVGIILAIAFKGKKIVGVAMRLLLFEYIFLIYCWTFLFRSNVGLRKYDLTPFWSYDKSELFVENLLNVIIFVPLGILLGIASKNIRWWIALLSGLCISVSIEILQFFSMRGFAEVDDVIHNTLGCMIGYMCYSVIRLGYKIFIKRSFSIS